MSKFIETRCGSILNLDTVAYIEYKEQKNPDYNEAMIEFVATNANNREFLLLSTLCKKEQIPSEYTKLYKELKNMLEII